MLWVKLFHILMVIAWMVGIFYLPRIYVHYVEGKANNEDVKRLKIMAQKLFSFSTIMGVFAIGSGVTLWRHLWVGTELYWVHAKLGLVILVVIYHFICYLLLRKMKDDSLAWSGKALRWFNELPVLILVGILYLVVFKPF